MLYDRTKSTIRIYANKTYLDLMNALEYRTLTATCLHDFNTHVYSIMAHCVCLFNINYSTYPAPEYVYGTVQSDSVSA